MCGPGFCNYLPFSTLPSSLYYRRWYSSSWGLTVQEQDTSTRLRNATETGTAQRPATDGGALLITHFCETYLLEPVNDQSFIIAIKEFNNLIIKSESSLATRRFFTKNLREFVELSSEDSFQHFIIQNYISNARFQDSFLSMQEYLAFLLQLAKKEVSVKHLQMLVKAQHGLFLEIKSELQNKQRLQQYEVRRAQPRTSVNINNCNLSQFEILPVIPGRDSDVSALIKNHPFVIMSHDELLQLRDDKEITEYVYIEMCLFWIFHHTHPSYYINNTAEIWLNLNDVKNEQVYTLIDSFNPFKVTFQFLSMLWKVYDIHKRFPECDFPEKDQWPVQLQSGVKNVCPQAPVHSYGWAKSLRKHYYFISEVTDPDRTMSVFLKSEIIRVRYPCGEGCLYCQ